MLLIIFVVAAAAIPGILYTAVGQQYPYDLYDEEQQADRIKIVFGLQVWDTACCHAAWYVRLYSVRRRLVPCFPPVCCTAALHVDAVEQVQYVRSININIDSRSLYECVHASTTNRKARIVCLRTVYRTACARVQTPPVIPRSS